MTPGQFLEIFVSINLQTLLLVLLCECLGRWMTSEQSRNRLWTHCCYAILALTILGWTLPHVRLFHSSNPPGPKEILASVSFQQKIALPIAMIWGTGITIALLILLRDGIRTLGILRSLTPMRLDDLPESVKKRHGQSLSRVHIYTGDSIVSPFCWQFQTPVLVLPQSFLKLRSEELELILQHELAHLAYNHPLHVFMQRIVQAFFWYHPAVYWAGRQADVTREMFCDSIAAQSREQISQYLRVLLKVAELAHLPPKTGLGMGFFFPKEVTAFTHRVRRLTERAQHPDSSRLRSRWEWATTWLLAALMTLAWVPVNPLSSRRSYWSACPNWTAEVLHDFGLPARDYEVYEGRLQIYDDENLQFQPTR